MYTPAHTPTIKHRADCTRVTLWRYVRNPHLFGYCVQPHAIRPTRQKSKCNSGHKRPAPQRASSLGYSRTNFHSSLVLFRFYRLQLQLMFICKSLRAQLQGQMNMSKDCGTARQMSGQILNRTTQHFLALPRRVLKDLILCFRHSCSRQMILQVFGFARENYENVCLSHPCSKLWTLVKKQVSRRRIQIECCSLWCIMYRCAGNEIARWHRLLVCRMLECNDPISITCLQDARSRGQRRAGERAQNVAVKDECASSDWFDAGHGHRSRI